MNVSQIRSAMSISIWVVPLGSEPLLQKGYVEFRFGQEPGEYHITQEKNLVAVKLRDQRQRIDLESYLGRRRARLAMVERVSKGGHSALVGIHFFNGDVVEMGTVDVGIDDHIRSAATRMFRSRDRDTEGLIQRLQDLCVLSAGSGDEDSYFLLTVGAAAAPEFEAANGSDKQGEESASHEEDGYHEDDQSKQSNRAPGTDEPGVSVPDAERGFCIHGEGIRIAVARKGSEKGEGKYLATRLINSLGGDPDGAVRLAHGRLTFSDFTRTGQIRALAAGSMARLLRSESGYLKKWDEYGDIEGELLLARARSIGKLHWTNVEPLAGRVKFFFAEPLPEGISDGDELEIAADEPVYLRRPELTWADYCVTLENAFKAPREALAIGDSDILDEQEDRAAPGTCAKVHQVSDRSLVLDLPIAPDKEGLFLVLSLNGDRIQIERRMAARRLIVEGRSANPELGLLIEEDGVPSEIVRPSRLKPLTRFVRRKVFAHAPTPKQEEAIGIALNTPDIALIQGPPGTGKTTVIAAIVERLNEMSDKGRAIQGEVLVSAFQQDAIENMMARLSVNAIPIPKFGRRSGSSGFADRGAEQTRRWSKDIAVRIRDRNPDLRVSETLRGIQMQCRQYVLAPSLDNAASVLDAFLCLPARQLPVRLETRAAEIRELVEQEISSRRIPAADDVLRSVWSLRASKEGFLDDGPAMARQVLLELPDKEMRQEERAILERASNWRSSESPPFLAELRRTKSSLLERYSPRAVFRIDKPRRDVSDFISDALASISARVDTGVDKINSILAEFLHELESNPFGVQAAVEQYGYVFAATCQQSQGSHIKKRKADAATSATGLPGYDTIIIDEAARSSPRDLLIPMSQGRKRIILVGDHRQLPHLINEDIAKDLETQGDTGGVRAAEKESDFIRTSMFQYLLSRLRQLHRRDGIKRWATLDQQFRMHPLLGDFVSDRFYRIHSPEEAFESPLAAEYFAHDLPGISSVPAVWMDVPTHSGEEQRDGTSRCRPSEARCIAEQLNRWIDSPEGRKLTFGIISFYKAQERAVYQELSNFEYTVREPDGTWGIGEDYKLRPAEEGLSPEERLRIGTVDAFQGMEFDVVFLSMVRSRRKLPAPSRDPGELARQERRFFGHLTSPNRLCVSMSRQKRLLVLVGDKAMIEHELARQAVPELIGFLNLCRTHGAVMRAGE